MAPEDDAPPLLPPVDPSAADRLPGETVTPELLASLLVDGDDDLATWALERALVDADRVTVYDGLLADAMGLVGDRWAEGRWSVADEHLASQTLLRVLDRVRPQVGAEWRIGPQAVLSGVAGEQHMLGLVCLAHLLTEQGWTVANLGADVPASDLVRFLARHEARLLAITASDRGRLDAVVEAVSIARSAQPRVAILLGGRLATDADVVGTLDLDAATTTLGAALRFAESQMADLSGHA